MRIGEELEDEEGSGKEGNPPLHGRRLTNPRSATRPIVLVLGYSRVVLILDAVMVGDFNRLHVETMHSLVNQLSMLLVTTVDIQLVLSSAIQSASINATFYAPLFVAAKS